MLFVGIGAPWCGGAGYLVRQDMLLRALARVSDLHLAMFDLEGDEPPPPFPCKLTALPSAHRITETRWRSLMNDVLSLRPMGLRTLDCAAPQAAVRSLRPEQFDAVVAYRCEFAHMAGVFDHPNLILDIDDPEHIRRAESIEAYTDGNHLWQRRMEVRRLRRFERSAARHSRTCLLCQPRDAQAFAGMNTIIVPNCIAVPPQCPLREATSASVLFVGNLIGSRQSPNVDALLWFLHEIWPRVRELMPECEFRIAGPIRDRWRSEAERAAGTRVLGFVDDLPPLFRGASLMIAPIRFGTGTRIKILEAMAWGCPVVSTTKGCEGIEVADERDLLVRDGPAELAEACARLVHNPAFAGEMARNAWRVVREKYDRAERESWLADVLGRLIRPKYSPAASHAG